MQRLGEERFQALARFGKLECIYPHWFLIVRELTRDEAIEKFGPVTAEKFGPLRSWKAVTFGAKRL